MKADRPIIELDEQTYGKFRDFKDEIVSTDVVACKGNDDRRVVSYFWNDEKLIDFMVE